MMGGCEIVEGVCEHGGAFGEWNLDIFDSK